MLTAGTDNIVGTAGNDTITASSSTFNSDDQIAGGTGNDTFSVSAAGSATVIANLSSVETVRVTQGGAANTDYALNMIGATGATELVSRLSTGEVSFDNVQEAAKVTAYGAQVDSKVTAGFLNSLASGTADSVSLKIDGGANTTFQVSGTTDTNEFETINLETAGSSKNTVAGIKDAGGNNTAGLKTLNVSGAADLDITLAGGATGASYDGSAATGKQTVTWGGNFAAVKGGSGADKIDVSGASFFGNTAPKAIDGGAGDDTLVINEDIANLTSNNADKPHTVTGIEIVDVYAKLADGGTADLTRAYAADKIAGESIIRITAENNDGTAGGVDGEDVTVNITGLTTEKINVSFKASATATNDEVVTVKMKDDTGSVDSVTVESVGVSGQVNSFALTVDRVDTGATNKVETVNFIASAADVTTTVGTTLQALTVAYSSALNLTGAGNLTITTVELEDPTGDATAVIDASAMTGKLTLSTGFKTTAGDTMTVKLGSGTNSVDFGTEALTADVVIGSTGTDTVKVKEAATDVEMTITNVDTLTLTGAGATKVISAKNFSNVGVINIVDAAANDNGSDNVKVTNIAAGQAVVINSDSATAADWDGDTITLDLATGVTALAVELKGAVALEGTGILKTDATTLTVTDSIKGTDGFYKSQTLVLEGLSSTAKMGTLNLVGGGASSSTATATLAVSGTTNVDLSTINATALSSNLDISGVTTKTGAKVTLGSGNNVLTVAIVDLARDALVVDGGEGNDKLVAVDLAATLYRPNLVSVETLDIDLTTGTATELSLADTTGVTTIELDLDSVDENFTVSNASSVTSYKVEAAAAATSDILTLGSAATMALSNINAALGSANTSLVTPDAIDLTVKVNFSAADADTAAIDLTTLTAAKATSITIGGSDTNTAGTAYVGKIDIGTLDAGELTNLVINAAQGDVSLINLTTAKLATVTVTGKNDVTLGTTTATTKISSLDASAQTAGTTTIGAAVDFTTSATVKLGAGNDVITLDILTEGGVTVDGGAKTGDTDTLKLAGVNNLGLTVVDLSAADQVTQLNGGINSAVQSNFESIDLSGLTGSFGANITGSSVANTIVATGNADNIVAGEGADIITGGAGADTIDLTETTAAVDTVVYSAGADGDTITGFSVANDVFRFIDTGNDVAGTATKVFAAGTQAALKAATITGGNVLVITDAKTQSGSAIQTALADIEAGANAALGTGIFIVSAGATGDAKVWYDNDLTGGDAVLVATLTGVVLADLANLATGNFAIVAG